jgi:pyruvate/2-oxoglutarate dehydrogenase complex dihydrolipoamide acyltransferase (E2) component
MASGHKGKTEQRKGKHKVGRSRPAARQRPVRMPLAAHRAYPPLLGLWGAMLGAGVVVVVPEPMVLQMLHGTLIGTWAATAQPALAWIAGGLLGTLLFAFAAWRHVAARRSVKRPSVAAMAARQVTPINPVRDLGSLRLDDPVETMPFSSPAWRDADLDAPQPAAAAPQPAAAAPKPAAVAPKPAAAPAAEPADTPRELDLAEFAELPGRNAVWVEEPAAPEPVSAPAPVAAPGDSHVRLAPKVSDQLPTPGAAALARLRAVPASELSLAEMVERFAGALHEVRETAPGRSLGPGDMAAREAALAEALKALEALSGKGRPAPRLPRREDVLPVARVRFQPAYQRARGAA